MSKNTPIRFTTADRKRLASIPPHITLPSGKPVRDATILDLLELTWPFFRQKSWKEDKKRPQKA